MIDVVMPQLGESVAEGTVTRWLVRDGDHVTRDQVLLEVATDKADTEVLAPAGGVVTGIAAAAGTVVPKQGLLCRIDESGRPAVASKCGINARRVMPAAPAGAKPRAMSRWVPARSRVGASAASISENRKSIKSARPREAILTRQSRKSG